ncbi:MAG: TonB-dependent siderophore receptor [Flavobacterium sp.]
MHKYNLFFVLTLLISSSSFAQEEKNNFELYAVNDTVKNKKGEILKEVIITANQQKKAVNVGKSGINPMDLPQATAVINQATIQNQQISSVTDLLKNVNGVYIMGTTGGYQEEIASRGFSLSSSNTFKNGIRYFNGMTYETSGLEKVEFLKGSAAILYGNVSAGGILNLITKKPKFDFGGEVGFRFGSFNTIKPTFDIYGAVNKSKKIAYRINTSFEKAESFRNDVSSERYYINPSFLVKFNDKTQLLIETDYTKDRRTPDFGAGIINYEIVDLPRNRFLGVSWGYYDSKQASATFTLSHKLSDFWSLNFVNGIRFYETDLLSNTRPNSGTNGTVQSNGNWTRSIQKAESKDNYFIQQLDLTGNFATGKIQHKLLVGMDSERFKTYTTAFKNYNNYDTINIFENYNTSSEPIIPNLEKNTLTTAPINRIGGYIQDLISFSEKWKLLAGVRYSYQETVSDLLTYSNNTTQNTANYDDAFSPRIGLIYQPTNNHSLFASYSNSFEINTGQDDNGFTLSPSIIDQYEIGIKNKLFEERLFLNVTAYQIVNDKFYQQSLSNGNTYSYVKVLAGEVKSQGVEVDVVANPVKGLSILAGYSFNETKYVDSDYFIEGSQLKYNPKNTANLNFNFNFETGKLKGLNFGLINTYFGTRYAGRPTRLLVNGDTRKLIYVKDFIQVDATLSYVCKKWAVRTKLSNVFNELSYNIHDDNSLNPIAPRNYAVSLNYTF